MSDCDIQDENNTTIEIQNNCKSEDDIMNLIKIIDKRELSSIQIMKKYNISSYRFYKILREYDLKTINPVELVQKIQSSNNCYMVQKNNKKRLKYFQKDLQYTILSRIVKII